MNVVIACMPMQITKPIIKIKAVLSFKSWFLIIIDTNKYKRITDSKNKIFNEAKKDVYGYKQIADQVGLLFSDNKILLEEILNNLFFIAASDGQISLNEVDLLRSISQSFSFDEKTFQRIFQMNLNNNTSDPYKILDVSREDTDQAIRKKWINLNKEHHPDNLIAKGMPKEFIEQSNKELAAINLAYDKIKEIRAKS